MVEGEGEERAGKSVGPDPTSMPRHIKKRGSRVASPLKILYSACGYVVTGRYRLFEGTAISRASGAMGSARGHPDGPASQGHVAHEHPPQGAVVLAH